MNLYAKLSLLSGFITIVLGILIVAFNDTTFSSWRNLLIATYILGYTHFIVGFIYQVRSVLRKEKKGAMKGAFVALFVLATVATLYFINIGYITLLGIFAIPYFMGHALLNEHTLIAQQTGKSHPWILFVAMFTWFTALLLLAVPELSFYYNLDLSYVDATSEQIIPYLQQFAPLWLFTTLPLIMLAGSLIALVYGVFTLRSWLVGIPLLFVAGIGTTISLFFEPINYVYLFCFILVYHFTLWMLHFGVVFYKRSQKDFAVYVLLSALVIVPLTIASVYQSGLLYVLFLNAATFVLLTNIHITLSFLNEPWFKRWFRLA